jgi:hypothetical protein
VKGDDGLRQLAVVGCCLALAVLVPVVVIAGVDMWLARWAWRAWRAT